MLWWKRRKWTNLDGIVTGVQMLEDFGDDLTLRTGILFAHGPVHQSGDIPVEMGNEIL